MGELILPRSLIAVIQGNLPTSSLVIASKAFILNVAFCGVTPSRTSPTITLTLGEIDSKSIVDRGGNLT